jgi:hypothetical protein
MLQPHSFIKLGNADLETPLFKCRIIRQEMKIKREISLYYQAGITIKRQISLYYQTGS